MPSPRPAPQVLDEEFLTLRAKLLEVAACLDRLDRAEGTLASDDRRTRLDEAIRLLLEDSPHRAEQLQLLFSREYQSEWRTAMDLRQAKES